METLAICAWITCQDRTQAFSIGHILVEEGLAACVNILDNMESIYHWQGGIETAREAVLVVKTRACHASALTARVRELHSYEVPCIICLPIVDGSPEYLAWIAASTREPLQ